MTKTKQKASAEAFQTRLWDAVKALELVSQLEVVVAIRPRSDHYRDVALSWGISAAWLGLTYFMFTPDLFLDELVYAIPVLLFAGVYALAQIPWLTRLIAPKKRQQKNVEMMARALFQKGGLHHTSGKTALLVYCSWLENTVYLLPDRGLEVALPAEEWTHLRAAFQHCFREKQPKEALLLQLKQAQAIFARYLPALPNDINELPDDLGLDL